MMNKVTATKHQSLDVSRNEIHVVAADAGRGVSRQQWLDTALKVFATDGVEAVRIVSLAKTLHISKSGFYWHFKDRKNLLEDMKEYWIEEFNQNIIAAMSGIDIPPKEKLLEAIRTIREKQGGKFDLAFAAWAQSDASVRVLVDRVTNMRIAFARNLLAELGYTGVELEARVRICVVYFSWSEIMFRRTAAGLEDEPFEEILKIIGGPRMS
jgi:AcrR family transcriptional regulator